MLSNWMTENPTVVAPGTTVADARARFDGFRHLAVSKAGLVGYLHASDLHEAPDDAAVWEVGFHSPMTVPEDVSLDAALQRLRSSRHDALWVLDGEERLVGVFTEHDAARVAAERLDPSILVDSVATAHPEVIGPNRTVAQARAALARLWVRHLPVVEDGALLGVLSWRDLEGVSSGATVRDLCDPAPVTARWNHSVREVAQQMVDRRIGAVPILDEDGALSGIITRIDLIRAVLAVQEVS